MARAQHAKSSFWWRRLRSGFQARREREAVTLALYTGLVAQAREPFLYAGLAVPDTREGRLEMVMLHAILVMRRLQREGEAGRALAQELFDLLFADLDRHLREWGVGDLSVGKEVKRAAQSFFARAQAAEPALAAGDGAALVPVLERNVYGAGSPAAGHAAALADYLLAQAAALEPEGAALLAGEVRFRPKAADGRHALSAEQAD